MSGTTLCPHCATRFKIAPAQLQAHQGMVRCGHCLQAFDARPSFIPDEPDPQLELPIVEATTARASVVALTSPPLTPTETMCYPQPDWRDQNNSAPSSSSATLEHPSTAATQDAPDLLDFSQAQGALIAPLLPPQVLKPVVNIKYEPDGVVEEHAQSGKPHHWLGGLSALLLLVTLGAQAVYFFRVEIAAHLPNLKPPLISYSGLFGAKVGLPHNEELISIESSDLAADPEHANYITLNALLRNRANYTQAFPFLELTLNDEHDQPLARRVFKASDYLPAEEKESAGLLANHELMVKLPLDTADLKPSGYRLLLLYSAN